MRALIYFLFILLFGGCITGNKTDNKINSSDRHRKDLILNSLQQTNPVARQTILEIIDTVEYYKSRLQVWPDSALYPILNRCRNQLFDTLAVKDRNCFANIVFNDTTVSNRFLELINLSDLDISDRFVIADFELINYQYLNKKYLRLLKQESIKDSSWERLLALEAFGKEYNQSVNRLIEEFIFRSDSDEYDEYQITLYYTDLARKELYYLLDFFLVITDYENFPGKELMGKDVDSIFELATSINTTLSSEQDKVVISENINSFYSVYRELKKLSENMSVDQRFKFEIFIDNLCYLEYSFLMDVRKKLNENR